MASEGNQEVKMMVTLRSKDGKEFLVERKAAEQSKVLKNVIEDDQDGDTDAPIPVEVTSDVLKSLLMYCEMHSEEPPNGDEPGLTKHRDALIQWDSKYMEEVKKNRKLFYCLINAANYLEIEGLLDLTTQTVADMIRGKSPEEIRSILGIKNDFTPEEERKIRQQNLWAFTPDVKGEINQQNQLCGKRKRDD